MSFEVDQIQLSVYVASTMSLTYSVNQADSALNLCLATPSWLHADPLPNLNVSGSVEPDTSLDLSLPLPGFVAPMPSVGPVAAPLVSSQTSPFQRGPFIHWGRPAHHAFIAGATSALVGSVWWSLFLYGGREDASALAVLISAMIPQMVIGGFVASLLYDTFQVTLLEKLVRPRLAEIVERAGLADLLGSLRGNQGLPNFEYQLSLYRMNALEHELSLHLLIEAHRQLATLARPLTGPEKELLAGLAERIRVARELHVAEIERLKNAGMPAAQCDSSTPAPSQNSDLVVRIDARYVTCLASTAAMAGALVLTSGVPEWTQNTRDLFAFFGIEAAFGMVAGYVYGRLIQDNVMGYVIRPLEARINRVLGVPVFAAVRSELAIPEPERMRALLERAEGNVRQQRDLLILEKIRLENTSELSLEERARFAVWERALRHCNDILSLQGNVKT